MHISPQPPRVTPDDYEDYLSSRGSTLTNEQRRYVFMAQGQEINAGPFVYEAEAAYAEIAVGGSLVTVKPDRPPSGGEGGSPGGIRGEIGGFSSASRRRLMRMIASMERDNRPLFVTLTYPDVFPAEPKTWKRDMDVFGKRFRRKFSGAGFVWRIEFKTRKSGKGKGKIAPHFHLLVWNIPILDLRAWADVAWHSIAGAGDEKHLLAGVSSERLKSWNGTIRYVSKYIAKVDDCPGDWRGRAWGVVGRKHLPWAIIIVFPLSAEVATRAVRLGRKMLGLTGKTLVFGLTWLMNSERMLDYFEFMMGFT